MERRGGALHVDPEVLCFCRGYATGSGHDGVDAFLCLATASAFREGFARQQRGAATDRRSRKKAAF